MLEISPPVLRCALVIDLKFGIFRRSVRIRSDISFDLRFKLFFYFLPARQERLYSVVIEGVMRGAYHDTEIEFESSCDKCNPRRRHHAGRSAFGTRQHRSADKLAFDPPA